VYVFYYIEHIFHHARYWESKIQGKFSVRKAGRVSLLFSFFSFNFN